MPRKREPLPRDMFSKTMRASMSCVAPSQMVSGVSVWVSLAMVASMTSLIIWFFVFDVATTSFYSVFDTNFLSSLSKNGSDSGPSAKDAADWVLLPCHCQARWGSSWRRPNGRFGLILFVFSMYVKQPVQRGPGDTQFLRQSCLADLPVLVAVMSS